MHLTLSTARGLGWVAVHDVAAIWLDVLSLAQHVLARDADRVKADESCACIRICICVFVFGLKNNKEAEQGKQCKFPLG